jgi:hypothetical protein
VNQGEDTIPTECDYLWILTPLNPGDLNCDGVVSPADIDPFVIALTGGRDTYEAQFPTCRYEQADINGDDAVSAADIDGFVQLLTGG